MKKSIAVDMKKPEGIKIIKELAAQSDVLIENFVPGKLENMGLGYSHLKQVAPHLVYCSITGFGSDGPYKERAGYDVIAASIGGLLSITGPEDGEPCKVGVAMTDISTGLFAHGAILAAILQRNRTGLGQKIDCNLLSTQVACLVNLGSNYLNVGLESKRRGTAHESIVPYQAFKTADGYITIGAGNNSQFETLCKIINCEHLLQNEHYKNNEQRVKNRKTLLSILSAKFSEKITEEWLALLHNSGIPYGPINSLEKVFNDPQVIHNDMIQEVDHPSAGKIKLAGPPVKFNNRTNQAFLPPPCLGQHTTEILKELLKYSDEKIEELKSLTIIQ